MNNTENTKLKQPAQVRCSAVLGEWIPESNQKPPEFESVIVWAKMPGDFDYCWHEGFWAESEWSPVRYRNETFEAVTHWMRGPDAPNGPDQGRRASDSKQP